MPAPLKMAVAKGREGVDRVDGWVHEGEGDSRGRVMFGGGEVDRRWGGGMGGGGARR